MYKIICVSSRKLCKDDFVKRIQRICDSGTEVILREKDLAEEEYYKLLCEIDRKEIIAHSFVNAARKFGCGKIHMPLPLLEKTDADDFEEIGVSTHSVCQAVRAYELGASYITIGHIFATDCKKGVPPHGTELITQVRNAVDIPVYAIGGINKENARDAVAAGADGVCMMSGFMTKPL